MVGTGKRVCHMTRRSRLGRCSLVLLGYSSKSLNTDPLTHMIYPLRWLRHPSFFGPASMPNTHWDIFSSFAHTLNVQISRTDLSMGKIKLCLAKPVLVAQFLLKRRNCLRDTLLGETVLVPCFGRRPLHLHSIP